VWCFDGGIVVVCGEFVVCWWWFFVVEKSDRVLRLIFVWVGLGDAEFEARVETRVSKLRHGPRILQLF
jgi:hypothetical protein